MLSANAARSSRPCRKKASTASTCASASSVAAVGALAVGAEQDQVALPLVGGEHLAQRARRRARCCSSTMLVHHARERAHHVDRRPLVARRQLAREHDVAVEDSAHLVGDRIVDVVAPRVEHGVDRGDRSLVRLAGALEQPRQHGEHRRRIALPRRRLAGRQADLALRARHAGERVEQQQHALAAVAEVLGDRGGDERRS